jgi:Redoxin
MVRKVVALAALCGILVPVKSGSQTPSPHPAGMVMDASGRQTNPIELARKSQQPLVVIFTTVDCPIANAYAPEIERIYQKYAPGNIRFVLAYSDPTVTREAVAKHRKDFHLSLPAVLDRQHVLVKQLKARRTPEAVVLLPDGRTVYQGRIDNKNVTFGQARYRASTHELRDALDAVCSGHPEKIKVHKTDAVGCYIAPPY